ncbi:unnamed protein product [Amoebophrya sp. A25]|nr:unnamed protein product [Amoebophrya sp. A25]|eukprot:GSA25T00021072001.1
MVKMLGPHSQEGGSSSSKSSTFSTASGDEGASSSSSPAAGALRGIPAASPPEDTNEPSGSEYPSSEKVIDAASSSSQKHEQQGTPSNSRSGIMRRRPPDSGHSSSTSSSSSSSSTPTHNIYSTPTKAEGGKGGFKQLNASRLLNNRSSKFSTPTNYGTGASASSSSSSFNRKRHHQEHLATWRNLELTTRQERQLEKRLKSWYDNRITGPFARRRESALRFLVLGSLVFLGLILYLFLSSKWVSAGVHSDSHQTLPFRSMEVTSSLFYVETRVTCAEPSKGRRDYYTVLCQFLQYIHGRASFTEIINWACHPLPEGADTNGVTDMYIDKGLLCEVFNRHAMQHRFFLSIFAPLAIASMLGIFLVVYIWFSSTGKSVLTDIAMLSLLLPTWTLPVLIVGRTLFLQDLSAELSPLLDVPRSILRRPNIDIGWLQTLMLPIVAQSPEEQRKIGQFQSEHTKELELISRTAEDFQRDWNFWRWLGPVQMALWTTFGLFYFMVVLMHVFVVPESNLAPWFVRSAGKWLRRALDIGKNPRYAGLASCVAVFLQENPDFLAEPEAENLSPTIAVAEDLLLTEAALTNPLDHTKDQAAAIEQFHLTSASSSSESNMLVVGPSLRPRRQQGSPGGKLEETGLVQDEEDLLDQVALAEQAASPATLDTKKKRYLASSSSKRTTASDATDDNASSDEGIDASEMNNSTNASRPRARLGISPPGKDGSWPSSSSARDDDRNVGSGTASSPAPGSDAGPSPEGADAADDGLDVIYDKRKSRNPFSP